MRIVLALCGSVGVFVWDMIWSISFVKLGQSALL